MVAVHQDRPARPAHHDDGLGKPFLYFVYPAFEFVFVDLGLGGKQVLYGDNPPVERGIDAVEFFERRHEIENFLRGDMLDLRADHIGIGDDPEQVVFLIHDREFLDAAPEDHPGGIGDVHLGICNNQFAGHGLGDGFPGLYKEKVAGGDVSDHLVLIKDREAVVFGLLDLLNNRFHRPMEIHADNIIGHIVLDLFLVHPYSFRRP